MEEMSRCPNCGAAWPRNGICEYCGTVKDPTLILPCDPSSGPVRILFKKAGYEFEMTCIVEDLTMTCDPAPEFYTLYDAFGIAQKISSSPEYIIDTRMRVVPEDGSICRVRQTDVR